MAECDKNGTGSINYKEFIKLYNAWEKIGMNLRLSGVGECLTLKFLISLTFSLSKKYLNCELNVSNFMIKQFY